MTKHKKFNQRDVECLRVARDLLLKGSPAFRIIKYCVEERHMTKKEIDLLCDKLFDTDPQFQNLAREMKSVCCLWFTELKYKDIYQYFGKWLGEYLEKEHGKKT